METMRNTVRSTGFCGLFLLLLLTLSSSVFSQETTGGIEGNIKDATGAVVPNVTLNIRSSQTTTTGTAGFRRTASTDSNGFFRVLNIPPGVYDVTTVAAAGFGEAKYSNVTVTIGKNTQLEIRVEPEGNVNTVDVNAADTVAVDTSNNAIQSSITNQKIEMLPRGTGFASLLKTVPGTRPESRTAGFSVDGASGGENVFVIDGHEVSNYRTGTLNETYNIPTQMVQEVQVKTSGFDAAFGGATGGVVSVVTRGGNNSLHGEVGLQFNTPKFSGKPRQLLTRFTSGTVGAGTFREFPEYFQPHKSDGTDAFYTFNLSGPIKKDKLWFYTSYSPQVFETQQQTQYFTNTAASTRTFITSERYSRTTKYEYAFGRLDANPFSNLRLTGTFLWNPVIQEGSIPTTSFSNVSTSAFGFNNVPTANYGGTIGTLTGSQFTSQQGGRQTSNVVTASGVWTPTSNLVFEGRYSRNFLNEKLGNYFVPTTVQIAGCTNNTNPPIAFPCSTTGANSITTKDVSIRESYESSVSYIFSGGGNHELKGGYQRYTIMNDVQSGNNAIGQLRFFVGTPISSTQPGVTDTPGAIGSASFRRTGTRGRGSNLSQGIFIQDKWQPMSRLTLNLGVRIEKEDLPTFNGFASGVDFGWGDKIAPRLGFALDLTGQGKTKVFASYGRFYDRVKFALPRGLFGGDIFLEDYFEIFPGDTAAMFNINNVIGSYTGPSVCPATGFIQAGVLSRCQRNLRVNANEPGASAYLNGAVDPDLAPFRQTEFTGGFEHQINRDYVMRVRYTYKNVDEAVEDAGIVNAQGSEAYIIGNPGKGLHLKTLTDLGYERSIRPKRRYDAVEVVLDKRFSNNWYFNANYTFSRLHGNYTGLASSDEAHLVTGRQAPGVSRAFDLPFIGFTAEGKPDNGPLPTDRPHVVNLYGAYVFDWFKKGSNSTEIAAFQTFSSGTPMTTSIFGQSSVTPQIFYHRGDLGRSDTFTETDLNVTHRYKFGRDNKFAVAFDLSLMNIWDQAAVTGVYPTMNTTTGRPSDAGLGLSAKDYANGYTSGALLQTILSHLSASPDRPDGRYKMPQLYQSPRSVRFGFRFTF